MYRPRLWRDQKFDLALPTRREARDSVLETSQPAATSSFDSPHRSPDVSRVWYRQVRCNRSPWRARSVVSVSTRSAMGRSSSREGAINGHPRGVRTRADRAAVRVPRCGAAVDWLRPSSVSTRIVLPCRATARKWRRSFRSNMTWLCKFALAVWQTCCCPDQVCANGLLSSRSRRAAHDFRGICRPLILLIAAGFAAGHALCQPESNAQ